jgi:hypothetical protein
MNKFFLILELTGYVFAFFLLVKKKELAVIYLPVLIFLNNIIVPVFTISLYYGTITLLLLSCINYNNSFFRNNIYALLIFIYFLLLIPGSSDIESIRPNLFSVSWLFLSIPLISTIYQKYSRDELFNEVSNAALLILILFIANVLFSTLYRYAPDEMYGITSGVLYGNLYAANFNVLTIAIFITVLKLLKDRKLVHLIVLILSLAVLLLSMRRSVMTSSLLGVLFALLTLLTQKEAKKFIFFGCVIFLIGYIIYTNTEFMNLFNERYQLRNLDDRALEEEGRFMEYEMLYKDMFVYNKYSPWFGFELFNSGGNYGKGIFDSRSLHSDLTNIAHSSGIIGVILYLLMVCSAFIQSFKASILLSDKIIILFCVITFITFTITGRYTQIDSMLLLYLILMLPLSNIYYNNSYATEFKMQNSIQYT